MAFPHVTLDAHGRGEGDRLRDGADDRRDAARAWISRNMTCRRCATSPTPAPRLPTEHVAAAAHGAAARQTSF